MVEIARDFNAEIAEKPVGEHDFLGIIYFDTFIVYIFQLDFKN